MNKCRGKCNIQLQGSKIQDKELKVYANVSTPIQTCVKIRADRHSGVTSDLGDPTETFKKFERPRDVLTCPEPLCNTTGTLYVGFLGSGEGPAAGTHIKYEVEELLKDYYEGVVNAYFTFRNPGSYTIVTKVYDKADPSNGVEFTDVVVIGENEPLPKFVVLPHSMDTAETKLKPSDNPFVIEYIITPNDAASAQHEVGISTISMTKTKQDWENNATVVLSCIDTFDMPNTVDLADATCFGQEINPDSVELEITLSVQQMSANYMLLNPLIHSAADEVVAKMVCLGGTAETIKCCGKEFTGMRLPGYYLEECGYTVVSIEACDAVSGALKYSTIKNFDKPDQQNYKILTDTNTGDVFAVISDDYLGEKLTVIYPRAADAEIMEATTEFDDGRRTRIRIPFSFTNGRSGYFEFDDVIITSFPLGWSTTENVASEFTIRVRKHDNVFYRVVMFTDSDD